MICWCRRRILSSHFLLWQSGSRFYSTHSGKEKEQLFQLLDGIHSRSRSRPQPQKNSPSGENSKASPTTSSVLGDKQQWKSQSQILDDIWAFRKRLEEEREALQKTRHRIDREKVGMFGQYGWTRERHERESKGNRKERAWVMGAHEPVILAKNKDFVLNSAKETEDEDEEKETSTQAEKIGTEKAGDSANSALFWQSFLGSLPDVESRRTPTSPNLEQSACLEQKHDSEETSDLQPRILQTKELETTRQSQCHEPERSKSRPAASGLRDGSPIDRNERGFS